MVRDGCKGADIVEDGSIAHQQMIQQSAIWDSQLRNPPYVYKIKSKTVTKVNVIANTMYNNML